MLGVAWKVVPGLRTGDWRSKLLAISQIAIALVALLGIVSMLTRQPIFLLGFATAQGLILVGVVLFVVVAVFAQRTLVEEEFDPGEVIFRQGDLGRDVYVIRSGTVEVLVKGPDGSEGVLRRLGPGECFGEMALLGKAPRSATIRTVTPVQVFKMSPSNFAALYTNLPGLKEHFDTVMKSRLGELESRR